METTMNGYAQKATPEEIWAILREISENRKEEAKRLEQIDRKFEEAAESRKETEKMFQHLAQESAKSREEEAKRREEEAKRREELDRRFKETERIVRRNSKQMGDLHRRFGELAEHLVAPNIHKRFNELDYHFGSHSPGGVRIYDEKGNTKAEIDLLLENGKTIMAIEVKTRPAIKDVEHHIKRLEILRDHRRSINDKRAIKGAIAGAIFGVEEKKATLEAGLYVVEQSGDTMRIDVPKDFVAREW